MVEAEQVLQLCPPGTEHYDNVMEQMRRADEALQVIFHAGFNEDQ